MSHSLGNCARSMWRRRWRRHRVRQGKCHLRCTHTQSRRKVLWHILLLLWAFEVFFLLSLILSILEHVLVRVVHDLHLVLGLHLANGSSCSGRCVAEGRQGPPLTARGQATRCCCCPTAVLQAPGRRSSPRPTQTTPPRRACGAKACAIRAMSRANLRSSLWRCAVCGLRWP